MKDSFSYHQATKKLRQFFEECGFIEIPTQSRISILAACEDPATVSTYNLSGQVYPLPQTGQMWLEHELLKNPTLPGVYCISTSYRDEPNPVEGRHEKVFPMFEFESKGGFDELKKMENDLLKFLGFKEVKIVNYEDACQRFGVEILGNEQEYRMSKEVGPAILLQKFPKRTSPFWNMKQFDTNLYNKVDVLLHGMETIGSAERSCDSSQMLENFYSVSNGSYAELLFDKFGKDRVLKELNEFLSLNFVPRFGGGIGVTRMVRALKMEGLLEESQNYQPVYNFKAMQTQI